MKNALSKISLCFLTLSNNIFGVLVWEKYQHLTPNNLCQFAECENSNQLSQEQIQILKRIIQNPARLSSFVAQQFLNKRFLNEQKRLITNSGNYILSNPDNEQEIQKSASHLNRLVNLSREQSLTEEGDNYKKFGTGALTVDEIDEQIPMRPTYQTSSSVAHFLLFNETIRRFDLQGVKVPDTRLVKLTEGSKIDDTNVFVSQNKLPNTGIQLIDLVKNQPLTEQLIKDFACAIVNGIFWNVTNKAYTDGEKIYLFDIEQPNKMRPSEAYFQNTEDIQFSIIVGLKEFYEILESGIEKQGFILQNWVKNGPFAQNLKEFKNQKFLKESLRLEN